MNRLFERLNVFSYTIYHSDGKQFAVWKDSDKKEKLYTINEDRGLFEIFDPEGSMLADKMAEDKVIAFIEADMGIGPPIPGSEIVFNGKKKLNEVMVDAQTFSKTERVIAAAAKRQGSESAGVSLLQDLISRQKISKKTSGTVKKKRKINISDLDLDDE